MQTRWFRRFSLLAFAVVLGSCATVPLDRAIQMAAENIETNVQEGQKIALLNFNSPTDRFSAYVLEELSNQLVNGKKVIVVERRELELISQETQFQMSGEVSDDSAQAIGKKLGAQLIVSGSLESTPGKYRVRIRALNVETAAIEASSSADISVGDVKATTLLSPAQNPVVVSYPAASTPGHFSAVQHKDWFLAAVRTVPANAFSRDTLAAEGLGDFFTLHFEAERLQGVAAPNRFFGPYALEGQQGITIKQLAGTLMASFREPAALKEREYLGYLQNASKWNLATGTAGAADTLELYTTAENGTEVVLVFTLAGK